jgi:N-acylglucosamine 2-epimerase
MLAKQVFRKLLENRETVRVAQTASVGSFRPVRHLSEATTFLKAVLDMQPLLDEEAAKAAVDTVLQEIMHEFLDRRTNTLREHILPEGGFINTPEGRRLNVGLTFQTIGYLLDLCVERGDRKMMMQVVAWALQLCDQAWDETAGGLNQYVDLKGGPSIFPDAQQKWAWVQVEAISCLMKGYFQTRHPDCPKWFKRIHAYTFQHFPDPAQPGWHLALDSQRLPLMSAKSIPEAGCFSLIKCLAETAQTLAKCGQLQPIGRNVRVS